MLKRKNQVKKGAEIQRRIQRKEFEDNGIEFDAQNQHTCDIQNF